MYLPLIIAFSVLFPLTHMLMSQGSIRSGLVTTLHGEWPFRAVYSLVSFLTLGPAAAIWWGHRHLGPELWDLPFWLTRAAALPLMLLALSLILLMLASPSPASMLPGVSKVRGVLRITRHPLNMAFAAFGLAHLVANGSLGDVVFFGQFVALGVLGSYHQDARKIREKGEPYRRVHEANVGDALRRDHPRQDPSRGRRHRVPALRHRGRRLCRTDDLPRQALRRRGLLTASPKARVHSFKSQVPRAGVGFPNSDFRIPNSEFRALPRLADDSPTPYAWPMTTAAGLIIGDEILSGKVRDTNGPVLIDFLRDTRSRPRAVELHR